MRIELTAGEKMAYRGQYVLYGDSTHGVFPIGYILKMADGSWRFDPSGETLNSLELQFILSEMIKIEESFKPKNPNVSYGC